MTTDHGSNIVAALKNGIRLDCLCHRLHTVIDSAWKDTCQDVAEVAAYEAAISDLCRFAKQSTGVQEQLPKSLKHGGDTRPWVSMFRRAESVEASYDTLVTLLTGKNRLELIAGVNRLFNRDVLEITKSVKEVFESLEKAGDATLQLVVPSYYLLMKKMAPIMRDSVMTQTLKSNIRKYLDSKFWTSINALHWMATFLDPTFKQLDCIPDQTKKEDSFKRNLKNDLDSWMMQDLNFVMDRLNDENTDGAEASKPKFAPFFHFFY